MTPSEVRLNAPQYVLWKSILHHQNYVIQSSCIRAFTVESKRTFWNTNYTTNDYNDYIGHGFDIWKCCLKFTFKSSRVILLLDIPGAYLVATNNNKHNMINMRYIWWIWYLDFVVTLSLDIHSDRTLTCTVFSKISSVILLALMIKMFLKSTFVTIIEWLTRSSRTYCICSEIWI